MRRLICLLAVVALTAAGSAHDFWLRPDSFAPAVGKPASLSLHLGDHFADEGERPLDKKGTVALKLLSADGRSDLAARDGKPGVRFTPERPGVHVVALERDARLITLEAKKFTAYLTEEGLDDVVAAREKAGEADEEGRERYRRYLSCYLRVGGKADAGWKQTAGHKLALVPLSDPTGLRVKDELAVRVLFDGEPLAGAKVTAFSRTGREVKARSARTTAKGEAEFVLGEPGMHLVRLVYMRRAKGDADASWHSWWAAMTFEVK